MEYVLRKHESLALEEGGCRNHAFVQGPDETGADVPLECVVTHDDVAIFRHVVAHGLAVSWECSRRTPSVNSCQLSPSRIQMAASRWLDSGL